MERRMNRLSHPVGRRNLAALAACFALAAMAEAAPIRDIRVVPVGPVPVNAEQVLAQVQKVVLRGEVVIADGQILAKPGSGKLLP